MNFRTRCDSQPQVQFSGRYRYATGSAGGGIAYLVSTVRTSLFASSSSFIAASAVGKLAHPIAAPVFRHERSCVFRRAVSLKFKGGTIHSSVFRVYMYVSHSCVSCQSLKIPNDLGFLSS